MSDAAVAIPCPQCKTKAKVPINKISAKGVIYPCPKCKTAIRVARDGAKVAVRRASAAEVAELTPPDAPSKKKKKGGPAGELAPAWVVTFADLATLLLTFFVLMLSFSNMDVVKYREMVGSVMERFGVTQLERGDYQAVSTGAIADVDSNVRDSSAKVTAREQIVNTIYDAVVREGYKDAASISVSDEGVRVRMKGRVLFTEESASLDKGGLAFLDSLVNLMKENKNIRLTVEGHTDDTPIRTARFPSNWELSTIRAARTLAYLVEAGAPANRLAAAGFAGTRPQFPNNQPETKILNRRVEFLFQTE
ncbi:MAG: OmpA family protein [Nitrospinae bacterium]|nr:OmpA family protein [Nitrospinota bacterium]